MKTETTDLKTRRSLSALKITGRVIGTLWGAAGLFILIATLIDGYINKSGKPQLTYGIMGIAIVSSMIIAFLGLLAGWWKSGIGGFVSFFGFFIAGALLIIDPRLNFSLPVYAILMVPSVLCIADWWIERKEL